ncbi:MAG: hypothetical protein IKP76_03410 [Bacilli bacterium]|nr:hypothetical protein [Bacilli bacterium]
MKFIKDNFKLIIFLIVLIVLIVLFLGFFNKEVEYKLEYDLNEYHVIESYYKDDNMYTFNVSKDDYTYDYAINHKYSRKRKLITEFITDATNDDYKCLAIKVGNITTNSICSNGKDYYDHNLIESDDNNKSDEQFKIYNYDYSYLVWNGYGYTDKNNNKDYNFLSKESYSNDLAYQFNEYIITPNYDQEHSFNKMYIYNNDKHTIEEWRLNVDISYDSYFLGNIGEDLYLFDVSNKVEYRMNIKRKKIKVATSKEMVIFYDKKRTTINKNKLIYNKILFSYDNLYNYLVFNNKIYYRYYKSDKYVRISNHDIKDIIYKSNDDVYYISGTSLYNYNPSKGETKIAESFEWNFNYMNKIFVFSR